MSLPGLKRPREAPDDTDTEPAAKKPKPTPPPPPVAAAPESATAPPFPAPSATEPAAAPSGPPPTTNLLTLYNLTALQSSVARRDPVTGEKINPLRKHYGGKVKQLGLEGRDKPLKKSGELEGLVDPNWKTVLPDGRTWWRAAREEAWLGDEDDGDGGGAPELMGGVMGKLDASLRGMKAGQMPRGEHEHWRGLLGLDDTGAAAGSAAAPAAGSAPVVGKVVSPTAAFLAKTAPGPAVRNSAPASPSRGRPERTGRKRRYDESSYEGY